jgi:hypothetical protein
MGLSELVAQYKAETDSKKKFDILRKILAQSIQENDPNFTTWLQQMLAYKPQEVPIGTLSTCSQCGGLLTKSKILKIPPRAEFWYFTCEKCGIERTVAFLSPYSKGVVHLQDVSMYEDFDQLKKFIDSHYDVELKTLLEGVIQRAKDPQIKAYSQYRLASLLKKTDPDASQRWFESALPFYASAAKVWNDEFVDTLHNLIVFAIAKKDAQRAIALTDQLAEHAKATKNPRLLISSMINKAIALEVVEKFEESAEAYADAMNLAEEKNVSDLFDEASSRLQNLLERVKDKDENQA